MYYCVKDEGPVKKSNQTGRTRERRGPLNDWVKYTKKTKEMAFKPISYIEQKEKNYYN